MQVEGQPVYSVDMENIDRRIITEAQAQSFDVATDEEPLIVEAAQVLLKDYRSTPLNHASNGKAIYATFVPAR